MSVIFTLARIASNIFTTLPPFLHQFRPEISSITLSSHVKYGINVHINNQIIIISKCTTRKIKLSI